MNRRQLLLLPIPGLIASKIYCAEKFWSKKPCTQWTLNETESIFTSSPWVRLVYLDLGYPEQPIGSVGEYRRSFRVIWTSAKTVRLARERLTQLKPSRLHRPEISADLLTKYYVIEINQGRISGPFRVELENRTSEQFVHSTSLEAKNNRYNLADYLPPTDNRGGLFFFKRLDAQAKPILKIEHEKVVFNMDLNSGARIVASFNLKNMVINGELDI